MVRRLVWDQDFAGSIPVTPTTLRGLKFGGIAQLVRVLA